MKNKLNVVKAAMAFKHLHDTGAFDSLDVKVHEEYADFARDVEKVTELLMKYDMKTIFDAVNSEEQLDEIMYEIESEEQPESDEDNTDDECPCDVCQGAYSEEDAEGHDSAEDECNDCFGEQEFKVHTASAFLHLFELAESAQEDIKTLQKENKELKKAITYIVDFLENNIRED